jgi:hypothetical protein
MILRTTIPALLALTLALPAAAQEVVGVAPVRYRLVGDDEPAPQKARMVEEQVAAGIGEAGRTPRRTDVPEGALVVEVAVEESGALYEFEVGIAGDEAEKGRFTGPFAGMLEEVRKSVRRLVEAHGAASAPTPAAEAPAEAPAEPAAEPPAEPPAPQPEEPATERNPLWIGSVVLTAAGGAALIAGVILFLVDDPCVDETEFGCREYFDTAAPAIPLAGIGGIAAGVGIAGLIVLEPERPAEAAAEPDSGGPTVSAGLVPRRRGARLGLSVAF